MSMSQSMIVQKPQISLSLISKLYSSSVEKWLETVKECKCLDELTVKILCDKVKDILIEESNVQPVTAPVIVCGDIHGQFYDLIELFQKGGALPKTRYVFLGDYVDRGYNSVETFEYLLCLKLKYPKEITLLRGNHESRQVGFTYGFYEEINKKYGNSNPWKYFNEVFELLPLAAIIEGKIFCVHAGLSKWISTVDQIRLINRRQEVPNEGAFSDLMWSDPGEDSEGWSTSVRGAGWVYGKKVVEEFNRINDLKLICRSHQLVNEGYKYWFDKTLVSVWSVPNYCYRCGNKAAIMKLNKELEQEFVVFDTVTTPDKIIPTKKLLPYFL